jgi:FtsP/CotA-like multicopper oxidase with cupredoxin domain
MLTHMSVVAALHPKQVHPAGYTMVQDQSGGMGGLVIGITVLPSADTEPVPAVASPPHKLQLVISENPDKVPLYTIEVNDPLAPPAPNKKKQPSLLGPPILLTRGQEAEIEVKNLTTAPTVIHWHGIELESYYDGVAGWTGTGRQTTPAVAPGTSFVARMAPPRAGTFIYHTHWHDETQLLNGIYGPLIVLQPEQKYDPEHDRTYVFSTGRYAPFGEMLLVNGSPEPDPATLHTGVRYRLRFINITSDESDLRVRLVRTGVPVQWTVVAKDGADLPPAQLRSSAADLPVPVGSTCDVEYQADRDGYVEMQVSARLFEALVMQPLTFVSGK